MKPDIEAIAKLSDSSNPEAHDLGKLWNAIDDLIYYIENYEGEREDEN